MKTITFLFIILLLVPIVAFGQQQTNVALQPVSYGGALIYRNINLLNTATAVSDTPANLYGYYIFNASASTRYFKLWNAKAADVTVGTTVLTLAITIPLPAGSAANVSFPEGIGFRTGITTACVTGLADTNAGAPTANDCIENLFYKN